MRAGEEDKTRAEHYQIDECSVNGEVYGGAQK
jgi:hypothetical protein